MTRGGRKKSDDVSERKCIVTGEVGPKAGLIRFVVGPDDVIVPDIAEKLPGRGIWISADRVAVEKAVAKGLFSRGAKRKVKADVGLVDQVEALLARRVIELLSLGRKSGTALAGKEKVKGLLVTDEAVLLLQASDGSEREKQGLRPPMGENTAFSCLKAQELGLAFGRDRVIHAALIAGGLAEQVRYESARLQGMRIDQG